MEESLEAARLEQEQAERELARMMDPQVGQWRASR